jgi:hypothetical protein
MRGMDPNPYPIAKVEIRPGGCILHKFVSYWAFEFYAGMVPGEYKSLDALTAGTLIIMEHSSIELSELRHIQLSKEKNDRTTEETKN